MKKCLLCPGALLLAVAAMLAVLLGADQGRSPRADRSPETATHTKALP